MPAFAFHAVDATGRRVRGREDAPSPLALTRGLESRGLVVIEVREGTETAASALAGGVRVGQRAALLELTRAIATLLAAGLPLARALGAAAHVATRDVRASLQAVRTRVERGEALATALAAHPALFPPIYIGLVRAGERSGDLPGALARLTEQLEREERLRARLLSLSIYPAILAVAGALALAVLAFFVLPRFAELLRGTGATLPRSTALVLGVTSALRGAWPALLGLVLVGPLVIGWALRTEAGRRTASRLLLRLPVIGSLRRQALAGRTARLLGVLVGGGAPLLQALDETVACLSDPLAKDEVGRIRIRVREGASLHGSVAEAPCFHPLFAQLVAVGEESGRLHEFLLKTAEILEERTERSAQRLVTLVEPAMIAGFGIVVAFVALSVLQAIYGVNAGVYR